MKVPEMFVAIIVGITGVPLWYWRQSVWKDKKEGKRRIPSWLAWIAIAILLPILFVARRQN
jgi:hypothetical protein